MFTHNFKHVYNQEIFEPYKRNYEKILKNKNVQPLDYAVFFEITLGVETFANFAFMYAKTSDEAHSRKFMFAKKVFLSQFAKVYILEIFFLESLKDCD